MRGVRERPIWKARRWCILCVLKINVVFMVWRQRRRWNRCPSSHLFRGSLARDWISELCSTGWENFARDRIGALGLVSYTFAINDCFVTGENADFRVFPLARPLTPGIRPLCPVSQGIRLLQEKRGCDVVFDYAFPTNGSQNAAWTTVSLCVEIPYLLGLVRFCTNHGIAVKQIYDWWC